MSVIQKGYSLVVTEVSRLSRSTKQFIDLIEPLKESKIQLLVATLDMISQHKK